MDERTSERRASDKKVLCEIGGCKAPFQLLDISQDGCMLGLGELPFEDGIPVKVEMLDGSVASGTVVWHSEGCAGIEFAEPLPQAAVAFNAFRPSPNSFMPDVGHDRFGRKLPTPFPLNGEAA